MEHLLDRNAKESRERYANRFLAKLIESKLSSAEIARIESELRANTLSQTEGWVKADQA